MEQVWCAGAHSDIGGGYRERGLADLAFMWMKGKAENCGLAFDDEYIGATIHPNGLDKLHNSKTGMYRLAIGHTRGIGNTSASTEAAHDEAVVRFNNASVNYKPPNLDRYIADRANKEAQVPQKSEDKR